MTKEPCPLKESCCARIYRGEHCLLTDLGKQRFLGDKQCPSDAPVEADRDG